LKKFERIKIEFFVRDGNWPEDLPGNCVNGSSGKRESLNRMRKSSVELPKEEPTELISKPMWNGDERPIKPMGNIEFGAQGGWDDAGDTDKRRPIETRNRDKKPGTKKAGLLQRRMKKTRIFDQNFQHFYYKGPNLI
jgi:hypothetical protein